MQPAILVLTNVPDAALAQQIASTLVEQRLAACVNILPAVQSVYRWQGALEHATEIPLMIKTTQARYAELQDMIRQLHPYEVPELVAVSIDAGLPAYLGWLASETSKELNA